MSQCVRDHVREMPPSAKLVFKVLETEGEMTPKRLVEETYLPPRTVRYALSALEEKDVLETRFNFVDARQKLYAIKELPNTDQEIVGRKDG